MLGTNKLAIWTLTGLLAVTTVFFNLYIFLMSLWHYRQNKRWTASETIITALSVANGAHQLLCYFWMTMDEVDGECLLSQTAYSVMLLLCFSLKFSIMWTSAFLTFYYSTKLVSTPNRCYTRMREAILKHVNAVVALISVGGLATCMPMLAVLHHDNDIKGNDCGIMIPDTTPGKVYEGLYLIIADVLPGLLMIKCCLSISIHLAIHLRSMKASTNGLAHGPKLGAQMRVIRMTLSLVFAFLCFVVVDLYVHYEIAVNHESAIVLTFFFTSLYSTISAMVLIYGKKTLWKALIDGYNICLAGYPCLSCLKVEAVLPPEKTVEPPEKKN